MAELTPIRREVVVEAGPDTAFAVFTDRIGSWWPVAAHSVYGEVASVAFRDGRIVESAPGRPDTVWGTVTRWEPPTSLAFTWHPGADADRASRVSVTFTPRGEWTHVRLEHAGWEVFSEPAAARDEYDRGWPTVLDRYRDSVREAPEPAAWTWVALLHRPGPAAPPGGTVFQDPRFAEHVAFLGRMRDAGTLVAAGSFADEDGAGMTVLRLPGTGRLADATVLATVDDTSVASGFFTVDVRPWNVVLHG